MLKLQKVNELAVIPNRAHLGDSGLDLYSVDSLTIAPNQTKLVGTGWKMSVPMGYEIQIRPRSGLAFKKQVTVGNSPGTIDSGFLGEIKVILKNAGDTNFEVKVGDRIAQMVIAQVELWTPEVVESLEDTARGAGGFGSTGV